MPKPYAKPTLRASKVLSHAVSIEADYAHAVGKAVKEMHKDIKREVIALFDTHAVVDHAMDGNIVSQSRITLNALLEKWTKKFKLIAKTATNKMIGRIEKNADQTMTMSLREISESFTVNRLKDNQRISDIISASTEEAANLIVRIPEKYLGQVQGEVMRSITTGNGLQDLVPFLDEKYEGDLRHARLVAMDQTRKAYNSIQAARAEQLGVKKFRWIHTGGSKHPRKDHQEMNGNIYSFDNLPIIDKRTDERGIPGQAINCRCKMALIFDLED